MTAPAAVDADPDRPGWLRLRLAGCLTVAVVRDLHAVAAAALGRDAHLTVDCAGVERVDAAAAQLLLALRQATWRAGRRCELTGVWGEVGDALRVAGVWDGATA